MVDLNQAYVSPMTLCFNDWPLEMAYRWHSLDQTAFATGSALAVFAAFELIALVWNVITVRSVDPNLNQWKMHGSVFDDFAWVGMHAIFLLIFFPAACVLINRSRCSGDAGAAAIAAILDDDGGADEVLTQGQRVRREQQRCPECWCCTRMCCMIGEIRPSAWHAFVSLSSVAYVVCYTRLWMIMGRSDVIAPVVQNAWSFPTLAPTTSGQSPAVVVCNDEVLLYTFGKGNILGAAYGMSIVLVMMIGSTVGGLRYTWVLLVQTAMVVDSIAEQLVHAHYEQPGLWFWPVIKVLMSASVFAVFSRRSEMMSRTAFVHWLRVKNANIKAELRMNPFTTASLSKWLARPAKESMALTRPLANSDPRDSFLNLQAAALIASPARGDSRSTAALIESQIQRDRESDFTRYGNRDRSLTSPELGKRRGECSVVGAAAADAFGLTPQRALSSGDRSAAGGIRIGSSRGSGQFQRRSRTTEAAQTDYLGRWDIPWSSVELERKTGSGGSGQVFAAKFDGARVAAKELYSQKMSGSLVELSREVSILSRLGNHPNVVGMYGITKEPQRQHPRVFIIMEWVDGGDLQGSIEKWRAEASSPSTMLSAAGGLETLLAVAKQIAAAMRFLHSNRALHLDLKPGNILVANETERGASLEMERLRGSRLKLTDFGLSSSSTWRKQQRVEQYKARSKPSAAKKKVAAAAAAAKIKQGKAERVAAAQRSLSSSGIMSSGHDRNRSNSGSERSLSGTRSRSSERAPLEAYVTVPGTPLYMAPELLAKQHQPRLIENLVDTFDVATKRDVYAYGILIAAVATGGRPYGTRGEAAEASELSTLLGEIADDCGELRLRPDRMDEAHEWVALLEARAPQLLEVMRRSWAPLPSDRPCFDEICALLSEIEL